MNVLIVNGSADLYGASRILLETIKFLYPHKIILVVPQEGLLTDFIKANKEFSHIQIIEVPSNPIIYRKMGVTEGLRLLKKMIAFKRTIRKVIQEHKIDWAYINTLSCLFAVPLLKLYGLKVFLHVHEILENHRKITKYINKAGLKWCDKIIAVSEPVRLNLLEAGRKRQHKKVVTVLNGIADVYHPAASKSTDQQCKTITLVGRIKPEKGIWFFLDSIALLPEDVIKKSRFFIIGGSAPGGEHFVEKLEKDIKQHIAKDFITYYPFTKNVTEFLNRSDVIVVPSLMRDPFPTTILEGLSAGKPVVATNNGGSVQSIRDGETGFLIEPSDTQMFADRLKQLIQSDALRTDMGCLGRQAFLKKFSLEIFEKNFMQQVSEFESCL